MVKGANGALSWRSTFSPVETGHCNECGPEVLAKILAKAVLANVVAKAICSRCSRWENACFCLFERQLCQVVSASFFCFSHAFAISPSSHGILHLQCT